jgi:PEGA domain/PDZ domain
MSGGAGRRSWWRRGRAARALLPVLLGVALLFAAAPVARSQGIDASPTPEEEDLTVGLKKMWQAYDRARDRIDDLDFAGAVHELNGIIEPRKTARPEDLGLEEIRLLTSAYDLRARALFNLGNPQGAEADFAALLALNPSYAIDRQTLSPKVVDLFDRVRGRVAGVVVLQIEPRTARVSVDGEPIDLPPTGELALLAGSRQLRVEADGYDPYAETLTVAAGTTVSKGIRLRPNRRTLEFITVPAGVTVSIDGAVAGTTAGPPTSEVMVLAPKYGFDASAASAPLPVPPVTPGEHKVTFERECFQPQTVTVKVALDLEHNLPLRFAPVILQEARTDLRISSTPGGAEVYIDGEDRGVTPLTITGLCGGERDIRIVKADVGSWTERIRMVPGQVNALDVRLRPTLLYAGTFRLDEWGRAVWSDADRPLLDELAKGLKTLNLVRDNAVLESTRKSIIDWMISDPAEVRSGTILPPAVLQEAARTARADLVLAGLILGDDPEHAWTLALYSTLQPSPDVVTLRSDRPAGVKEFVERLDSAPAQTEPWWGMGLVDTLLGDGPLVVRVLPGSPAAKGGLRVGDRIRAIGNSKPRTVREVTQALAAEMARPAGIRAAVVLSVDNDGGPRSVRLEPGESPVVVPLTDPSLLYNRALAEFRLRARAATDDGTRGVALLNLGIAYMHFRAYDKAMSEGLSRATLPRGPGISEGTVLFYRGLCALRRGDPGEAKSAFQVAAGAPSSTIDSGDGPSAGAAAARMLAALQ